MANNLFPYPGNKARHAEWIIQHIPEHRCYIEPFGGAAGVLFNKPMSWGEVYNDVHDDIVQFFKVLRDRPDELVEWLNRVPYSRTVHENWSAAFYEGGRPDDDIERAGRFFYLRYSQWGGEFRGPSGFNSTLRISTDGTTSHAARKFRNKVDDLDQFAKRLQNVIVENREWEDIIAAYDQPEALFYCDPPYVMEIDRYEHAKVSHRQLCEKLSSIKGRAIISYDSIPECYGENWHIKARESHYQIENKGEYKECTEYILMNFDPNNTPKFTEAEQSQLPI